MLENPIPRKRIPFGAIMTVLYKIDSNLSLIYYAGFGLCAGNDILAKEREAFKNHLRVPEMKIVMDLRFAELDISLQDIRDLIELNRQLINNGYKLEKTAVISKDTFLTTFGETIRLMADKLPLEMNLFSFPRDAANWLGLAGAEETIEQIGISLLQEYKTKA